MTTMEEDRRIKIGGKEHILKPFKLKQLRKIARMGATLKNTVAEDGQDQEPDEAAADFGFDVLTMALENMEPPLAGDAEDAEFEPDELQDALQKVMKLAALRAASPGEAAAPTTTPPVGA